MGQDQSQGGGGKSALSVSEKEAMKRFAKIEGLQVVRLLPNSVAHRAGLVPYFDIITGIEGVSFVDSISKVDVIERLESQGGSGSLEFRYFRDFLSSHKGEQVRFDVFNLLVRHTRQVSLTIAEHATASGLLGCSIEWNRAVDAVSRCWHIVDVLPKSPAAQCADIHPGIDYVLGMQQPQEQIITLLHDDRDFYQRMELWQTLQRTALFQARRAPQQPSPPSADGSASAKTTVVPHSILLLVYNAQENAVKEVLVEMGTHPGTPLGLGLATGAMHWIPSVHTTDEHALPVMNHFCLVGTSFETSYHEAHEAPASRGGPANVASTPTHAAAAASATAVPSPGAGGVSPANPFRAQPAEALPAYPPPPAVPAAPHTTLSESATDALDAAPFTPPQAWAASPPSHHQPPPHVLRTAEPSFGNAQSLSDSFPRAGGEVHLADWAKPSRAVSPSGASEAPQAIVGPPMASEQLSGAQPHLTTAPPPPPPPQHPSHEDDRGPRSHDGNALLHAPHYPDPAHLGVAVTHAAQTPTFATSASSPHGIVSSAENQTRTVDVQNGQPPRGQPAEPVVDKAAGSTKVAVPIAHPPFPPRVAAPLLSAWSPSPPPTTPPRPPAYVAKASLKAVPRPPLTFDLFGDTPSKA